MITQDIVKTAMDQVLTMKTNDRHTVGLRDFVNNYLPILASKELPVEEIIGRWLAISKHPYNEVDVLNEDGTIAYVVPPIWSKLSVRNRDNDKRSLSEIMIKANAKSLMSPKMGDAYLKHNLNKISSLYKCSNKHIHLWNDILINYGYEPIKLNDNESSDKRVEDELTPYGFTNF